MIFEFSYYIILLILLIDVPTRLERLELQPARAEVYEKVLVLFEQTCSFL